MMISPENPQANAYLSSQRVAFIDIAKGLLIILVVFGHAWRAVFNNGILQNAQTYHFVDDWIYAFHMPAFFFLSGLFALKAKQQPFGHFIGKKLRTIVYPYFLWSILQSVTQLIMSGSTTRTISVPDILKIPIAPVMQFWFLYALFFVFLFFILMRQLTASPAIFFIWGLLLFVMAKSGYIPLLLAIIYLTNYFIYFGAGIFFANSVMSDKWSKVDGRYLLGILLVVLLLAGVVPWVKTTLAPDIFAWLAPAWASPGVILTLILAFYTQTVSTQATKTLALLGKHSLEIFVMHTICSAGFRIVTSKLAGINNLSIHLTGAVIAGILCPMFCVYLSEKMRWRFLFSWPR